jgi:hypothetical protein
MTQMSKYKFGILLVKSHLDQLQGAITGAVFVQYLFMMLPGEILSII